MLGFQVALCLAVAGAGLSADREISLEDDITITSVIQDLENVEASKKVELENQAREIFREFEREEEFATSNAKSTGTKRRPTAKGSKRRFTSATRERESSGQCLCNSSECALASNNILTTIPKLYPQFFISFEIKVNQFDNPPNPPYGVHNIIHLTTGGNCGSHGICGMGQRLPAVFIFNGGTPSVSVYVSFAVNGNGNYAIDTPFPGMQINTWYTIEISQKWDTITNKYKYKVDINGSRTEVINTTPKPYPSVLVYASENESDYPAYPPVDGSIRNLYINPSQSTMPNCA